MRMIPYGRNGMRVISVIIACTDSRHAPKSYVTTSICLIWSYAFTPGIVRDGMTMWIALSACIASMIMSTGWVGREFVSGHA